MSSAVKQQQRLWSEEDKGSESEPENAADKQSWTLDAETKRVGRVGLAAAREGLRQYRN